MSQEFRSRMEAQVRSTQDRVCAAVEGWDGGRFREDTWDRPGGGGGRSRVMQDSTLFEKAGVNVSTVWGTLSETAAKAMRANHDLPSGPLPFWVTGVSLVLHPRHPLVPTIHANYRYFEIEGGHWWFGGGTDLTPAYVFEEDIRHFHGTVKAACDRHDAAFYPKFKAWADDYFMIQHRGERRGVGGIFFDDLADRDREQLFAFSKDCQEAIVPAYEPSVRRRELPFTERHERWQQIRRGRYVEFNLVYDRGTLFGLRTDARIESVLMSLPLTARYEYLHVPETAEELALVEVVTTPRAWV